MRGRDLQRGECGELRQARWTVKYVALLSRHSNGLYVTPPLPPMVVSAPNCHVVTPQSDGLVLVGSATRERDPDGGCGCGSSDDTADSALVGLAAQEQQQAGQAEAPSVPGPGPGPGWASGAVPEGAPMAAASSGAAAEGEAAAATV